MLPKAHGLLEDMRDAAANIAAFTAAASLDDYLQDQQLRWSVERGFEIIGEALSQLARCDPTLAARISEHRKVISFRNLLIHGYGRIDHTSTWEIVQIDLPHLRHELEQLLAE